VLALLSASLCLAVAVGASDGSLSEPDIAVAEYEPAPSLRLLDALPLFDTAAATGGQRRTPSHTKMPSAAALPEHLRPEAMAAHAHTHSHPHAHPHSHSHSHPHPHAPPPPPHLKAAQQQKRSAFPPVPAQRPRGKPSRRTGAAGGATKGAPRAAPGQPGFRGKGGPTSNKRSTKAKGKGAGKGKNKAKSTKKSKRRGRKQPPVNRNAAPAAASAPMPAAPSVDAPRFDAGEVDPVKARRAAGSGRPTGARPPPPPFGASVGPSGRMPPRRRAPVPPSAGSAPDAPVRELSPREIREQQARLYEQQRAKYAQLVAFHRGEPGAEFPSAFEAGAGGGAATGGAAPPAPPSIEEMREQLRAEGLMQPPPAFDSVEMGGPAGVGSRSPFTVPAPRDRRFALPPAPRNPAWKGEGRARRRRRIGPGAIERLTHAQSLRDNRVQANAAKQAQLEKSEKDTAQAGASDARLLCLFFFCAPARSLCSHSIASLFIPFSPCSRL
jgi:hypothetical protein